MSEDELWRQRDAVRALIRSLVAGLLSSTDARVRTADARWEGCRSAFPDTYASYRYAAQVRLDAVTPDLDRLRGVLGDGDVGGDATPAGPDRLHATRGDLSVTCWRLPSGSELLLTVQGPCLDVPEGERDVWRDRREDQPDPLA